MPIMLNQEGVQTCFAGGCGEPPHYRVITLTADGTVRGEQVGGTSMNLLCKECLVEEVGLDTLGDPVEWLQKDGSYEIGPPEIAMLVLPLKLTKSQVAELREQICEEVPVEKPV